MKNQPIINVDAERYHWKELRSENGQKFQIGIPKKKIFLKTKIQNPWLIAINWFCRTLHAL